MKKAILYGTGSCFVLATAAAVVVYMKLGVIVKTAVETIGPKVTRTEVRLRSARLFPFSGRGHISGVLIGNPPGFKAESAFKLQSVRFAVDLKSLRSDRVLIREVRIDGPEVTLEGSLSGNNLTRIQKNVESFIPVSSQPQKQQKELKVEVGLFKVTNGKVHLSLAALGGRGLTIALPDIELRDIGRKSNGVTVGEAAQQMLGAMTGAATKAAAGSGELLKGGVQELEKARQAASGLVQSVFAKKKKK